MKNWKWDRLVWAGAALASMTCFAAPVSCATEAGEPQETFKVRPDPFGMLAKRDRIDVNLGSTPEAFVRFAYEQINGTVPTEALVHGWADKMRASNRLRRIDIVRALCVEAGRPNAPLDYSDPWLPGLQLSGKFDGLGVSARMPKKHKRDIGAVIMYFFNCPGGVNGKMDWANTHAPGMDRPSPLLGFGKDAVGYYDPSTNPGFWRRELTDAKSAGLDFVLLNTLGPDLSENRFATLLPALKTLKNPMKIALFDDTWAWGEPYFGDSWKIKPDLKNTEESAATIYKAKWQPFFRAVGPKYRYLFHGRPLIYFYNAGTLEPRRNSAAVLGRMKDMFKTEFGVRPFVVVDSAYFEDPNMEKTADAKFTWFTFGLPDKMSESRMNGYLIDHAMVKWDPWGRDKPTTGPGLDDLIVKGPETLQLVLDKSRDADMLVLATWNDLGEGTGINRNYDYYYDGKWLQPDYFMRIIRKSQDELGRR